MATVIDNKDANGLNCSPISSNHEKASELIFPFLSRRKTVFTVYPIGDVLKWFQSCLTTRHFLLKTLSNLTSVWIVTESDFSLSSVVESIFFEDNDADIILDSVSMKSWPKPIRRDDG